MSHEVTFLPNNESVEQLLIKGVKDQQEATDIAENWCEEHNCILQEVKPVDGGYLIGLCPDDYQ